MHVAVSVHHWVNLKESEKRNKYLYLARKLKKAMGHESDVIPIVTCAFGTVTGGLVIKSTCADHPNYRVIKIGHNTEKSSGDLRRTVTQTPEEDHLLTLV